MELLYTTSATTKGGMDARVKSENGLLDLEIRAPKEMGGPGGEYTNPEELFAVGYSACFHSAINFVAFSKRMKLQPAVTASVHTGKNGKGGFMFSVDLDVYIGGVEQEEAESIVKQAETVCPYSNATHGNIEVKIHVTAGK